MPFIPAVGVVRHASKLEKLFDAGKAVDKVDDAADAAKAGEKAADAADVGKKIHGNSLDSPKQATLYELVDSKTGEKQKYGVTSASPIESRYSKKFMSKKEMNPLDQGPRRDMIKEERELVENTPGPLNKEPWAGQGVKK